MFAPDPGPLPLLTDARPRRPVGPGPREAWGERLSRVVGIGCGRFTSCWRTRRPGGPGVLPSGPLEVCCSSTTRAPEIMCDLAAFPEKCVMFMHKTARNFRDSRTSPPPASREIRALGFCYQFASSGVSFREGTNPWGLWARAFPTGPWAALRAVGERFPSPPSPACSSGVRLHMCMEKPPDLTSPDAVSSRRRRQKLPVQPAS